MQLSLGAVLAFALVLCYFCDVTSGRLIQAELRDEGIKTGPPLFRTARIARLIPAHLRRTCGTVYNNNTNNIIRAVTAEANECLVSANISILNTNKNIHDATLDIRQKLLNIQRSLVICTAKQNDILFLDCVTDSFQSILSLLDTANEEAFHIEALAEGRVYATEGAHRSCVSAAIGTAKIKLSAAASEYNICLLNSRKTIRPIKAISPNNND